MEGFHEIVIPQDNIPAMVMIHHSDERPCQSHWHEGVELVASLNSELNIWCDGKKYQIPENGLALFNSTQIHKVTPIKHYDDTHTSISLCISPKLFKDYCKSDRILFDLSQNRGTTEEIICYCEKLYKIYEQENSVDILLEANSILFHIVYLMVRDLRVSPNRMNNAASDKYFERYRKLITYMEERYAEPITLELLAKEIHISKEHLSREFRTYTGESFRDHLVGIRLNNAQRDLLYSDLPLIDVAINNGFSDLRSYNRAFQKYYHTSPQQYRKTFSERQVYN